jgi:hypothetical protein
MKLLSQRRPERKKRRVGFYQRLQKRKRICPTHDFNDAKD